MIDSLISWAFIFSIALIIFSLLAELPHEVLYYFRLAILIHYLPKYDLIICCRMKAWVDLTLLFLTFFLSIIWNIEVGVVVSLIISLLMVVYRSSKTRMTILVWQ